MLTPASLSRARACPPAARPHGHGRARSAVNSYMVKPFELPEVPTGLMNFTDHGSRVVRTQGQPGMQGYNAQLAVNDRQFIVAAEITTEPPDFGHLEPMVRATQRELAALGLGDPTSCSPTPAYWHQRQMQQIASEGIQVLVPPDAGLRRGARPTWTGGMYSFMRRVLATPHGHDVYPPTPAHDRARLRPDQVQPRDQTLPTPRQNRLPQRMEAHRRDPQPAEAPQPPPRRRDTMIATAAAPPPPRSPPRRRIRAVAGLTRQRSTRR